MGISPFTLKKCISDLAPVMTGICQGMVAGAVVSVIAICLLSLALPQPGVPGTRPGDLGPEQRKILSSLYPSWINEDRTLTRGEKLYSDMVIESLCLTIPALAAEMETGMPPGTRMVLASSDTPAAEVTAGYRVLFSGGDEAAHDLEYLAGIGVPVTAYVDLDAVEYELRADAYRRFDFEVTGSYTPDLKDASVISIEPHDSFLIRMDIASSGGQSITVDLGELETGSVSLLYLWDMRKSPVVPGDMW